MRAAVTTKTNKTGNIEAIVVEVETSLQSRPAVGIFVTDKVTHICHIWLSISPPLHPDLYLHFWQ